MDSQNEQVQLHDQILRDLGLSVEDMCRSIFNELTNFILIVDREGTIKYINRVTEWLTVPPIIGKSAREFIVPEQQEFLMEQITQVFTTGEAVSYRVKGFGDKGHVVGYASKIVPIHEKGPLRLVAIITLDLGDLRERMGVLETK